MNHLTTKHSLRLPILAGTLVGLFVMALTIGIANAAPLPQDEPPVPPADLSDQDCKSCHLNIANTWSGSPHAHAFDDLYFQERWTGLGNPGDCLLCHTTNYQATQNMYTAEGVSCEACHGPVDAGHPPAIVSTRAESEYCGTCHTTTQHEWRLTGHARAGVGCMDCHDPHSQQNLFEVPDDLCINCHKEDMQDYLEDLHIQKNIGCVDCHALVIPPETPPDDGIVPTGHTFTITPKTCVACHTDALHAGFSLPGFDKSLTASITDTLTGTLSINGSSLLASERNQNQTGLSADQRIQALEATLANRQLATLFQGGIIGLVLGGTTAWFVARNMRRSLVEVASEDDQEEEQPSE